MDLFAPPFQRRCAVQYSARPAVEDLRRSILRNDNTQSDLTLVAAPLAASNQTFFQIVGNEKQLLLGVMMLHTTSSTPRPADYEAESLELFFDLRHDGIGWQQLIFNSDGSASEYSHLPYPEAHSSAYPPLRASKWETRTEGFHLAFGGAGCRWFFVWLDARDLFRESEVIGLNLCRSRNSGEFSAWNFAAGNGAPDATGFGELHRDASTLAVTSGEAPPPKYKKASSFKLSATYDPPMCVLSNHYTPQRLRDEMAVLKSWGISRLHWIDYSKWPSFWEGGRWSEGFRRSERHCGNLLSCAVEQAKANGLEILADLKIFDLGMNSFATDDNTPGAARELDNYFSSVVPEIADHRECAMQSNLAWRREPAAPVATLRFFSDEPVREIQAREIQLWVSDDNKKYSRYRGRFTVEQGVIKRPHQRWTPAGNRKEQGSARNWFIEISGLRLSTPFAALRIGGEEVTLHQRGFMLMEVEDRDGNLQSITVATKSTPESETKYAFWKEWPGWSNVTEPLLQRRAWSTRELGFSLRAMTHMPTLLEPASSGARKIWLDRIAMLLDSGVDGVGLRIFTHHNGVMHYLHHAFAPAVVEEFRNRFGRSPEAVAEDYERVRRLRGDAMTQFIREAKQLTRSRSKKLMVQLESGIEVPPHLDTRMQLFLDYKTWLREKLVDEVSMKFFSPYSRFVHEEVLPLAQKQKIPVHIISRNLNGVLDARATETIPRVVTDARELGFSGYNFYETANLIELNPEGISLPKGLAAPALCRASEQLRLSPK